MKQAIAIMQPYLFPYIGYFQLINAVDTFVFYDDVNYIKQGWINRNKILVKGKEHIFTVPLRRASSNKLINQVGTFKSIGVLDELLKILDHNYKRAPYFNEAIRIVKDLNAYQYKTISELSISSVKIISKYLELNTTFKVSSEDFSDTLELKKSERLISITKKSNNQIYINPTGGKKLYNKHEFESKGISLKFIENGIDSYQQFNNDFVPCLSILDVLMFNSIAETRKLLMQYHLS